MLEITFKPLPLVLALTVIRVSDVQFAKRHCILLKPMGHYLCLLNHQMKSHCCSMSCYYVEIKPVQLFVEDLVLSAISDVKSNGFLALVTPTKTSLLGVNGWPDSFSLLNGCSIVSSSLYDGK